MVAYEFTVKEAHLLQFKKRRFIRQMVQRALSNREISKATHCELCNKHCVTHAHHTDYGKPLQINWLCRKCHGLVHRKDHPLNPANCTQSALPAILDNVQSVHVSFNLPVGNYLALCAEAENKNVSVSKLLRQKSVEHFPIRKNQLEFKFEVKNDEPQSELHKGVQSMAKDESLLHEPQRPILSKVRRARNISLTGMERLQSVFNGYGGNSKGVQRNYAH